MHTIVVDEIRHADAEECGVQARIEARNTFSLDDSTDGVVGGRLGSFGLDLCSGGESDERITEGALEVGLSSNSTC